MRIIPRLDMKGGYLVKGVHLEGLKSMGPPWEYARRYYEGGADELILMDAVASLYGRNTLTDVIAWTAEEIFIPLTVGGGLRSLDDMRSVLRTGADKIAVNTAAVYRPDIIREASSEFGSSTVVVSIDAQTENSEDYQIFTENGREPHDIDPIEWARTVEGLGAGEILLTAIHREGTGLGFDIDLTRRMADAVSIPVIASGGAGNISHVRDLCVGTEANAVALASVLHFNLVGGIANESHGFGSHGEFEIVDERFTNARIESCSIGDVKKGLVDLPLNLRSKGIDDV